MAWKQLGKAASGSTDLMTRADVLALLATKHAKFTGALTTVPAISLGQTQTLVVPMSPVVAGDALVPGEDISWVFSASLPQGINVAQVRATAAAAVTIDFTSSALLSLQSVTVGMRVTAHR